MIFTRDAHFSSSPYCVTLQAKEFIRNKIHRENSTVCIFTSTPIQTIHGIEILPQPLKYRDEQRGTRNRKFKNGRESDNNSELPGISNIIVEYPEIVKIQQNASLYARVAEPIKAIVDKNVK